MKSKKLLSPRRSAMPAITAALAAAGLVGSAQAAIQTAGALLVNVDATTLPVGPLTSVPNSGTAGGFFEARGGPSATPRIEPVYVGGTKGIKLDGSDYLMHVAALGGPPLSAPAGLTGPNPTSTVEVWVLNPWMDREETVVAWGHRGGGDGQNKSLLYGFDGRWGAIGHWGAPDIGWDPAFNDEFYPPGNPVPGVWHHLVYTYDGTTTRVYADGVLKNSETIGLNTWPLPAITIGAQLTDDASTVEPALRATMTIAKLRIHEEALTDAQVLNNYNAEAGSFSAGVGTTPVFGPIHRYSFSIPAGAAPSGTVVPDSAGTDNGVVLGDGATSTGSRVSLPGGGSGSAAYVDLPNGMISLSSRNNGGSGQVTIEGWTKVTGLQTWARVFDFGSSAGVEVNGPGGGGEGLDYLTLSAIINVEPRYHQLELRNVQAPTGDGFAGVVGSPTMIGREFHWVVTWDEQTGQIVHYEDGGQAQVFNLNPGNNPQSSINDVNVWLGRSNWNGDSNGQEEFDEVRIYDRILSPEEVKANNVAGPGAVSPPQPITIVSQPQNVTVEELNSATFRVAVQGLRPYTFQWYSNNVAIPGATSFTLTLNGLRPSANGAQIKCVVGNTISGTPQSATSTNAILTVIADTTPPTLLGAAGGTAWGLDDTHFGIRFSEPVNTADATTLANYSGSGITLVPGPLQLLPDNVTVVGFTTAASLKAPGCKSITVTGVIRDRAPSQNPVAVPATAGIVYAEGTARYHQWNNTGVGSVDINSLRTDPDFPNNPDVIAYKTTIEGPDSDGGDNFNDYGSQLLALISPPVSGAYRFFLAADDHGELYLSTDENPANKVLIAREPNWGNFREWIGNAPGQGGRSTCATVNGTLLCENVSNPINLQSGCRYYLEVLHKEAGGGDYASVNWQVPGAPFPANGSAPALNSLYISPFEAPPAISSGQPADQTVDEGRRVTLTANITGSPVLTIQWFRGPDPITGANAPTYITDPLRFPADDGAQFHVEAMNSLGSAVSRTAIIHVNDDSVAPLLLKSLPGPLLDIFTLKFNEIMDKNSAEDAFNYTVNGINPSAAALSADGTVVTLTFGPQTPNTDYMVHIENVQDFSGNPIVPRDAVIHSVIQSCGGVNFQGYLGIGGNAVTDLTGHPNFPNNPQVVATVPNFDSRGRFADDSVEGYGARMRGVFLPPISGSWVFYLRSDDASELRLNSSGVTAAGAVKIAEEPGCCGAFEAHTSAPIPLLAGEAYYIECLYKEGTGGDYGQVAARLQGSADALSPIQGSLLGQAAPVNVLGPVALNPAIPADLSVLANAVVSFSVGATAPQDYAPLCYQWERDSNDGNGFQPIGSANGPTYGFGPVSLTDNGAKFRCIVGSIGSIVTSREALLGVTVDTNPPVCTSIHVLFDLTHIDVRFSEFVDPATASDAFNYTVDGANPPSVALRPDGMSVRLTLASPLAVGSRTCISIQNVTDLAGNVINPNPSTKCMDTPIIACGLALCQQYYGIPGNPPDFPNAPQFPNDPDNQFYVGLLESPTNVREDFGTRISGWLRPPVSGNYNFWLSSDDLGTFMLSTDENPANAVLLCSEPQWGGVREWQGNAGGRRPGLENQSKTLFPAGIPLVAGQMYWFQALSKEGGGGDNLAVAWQIPGDPEPVNGSSPIQGVYMCGLAEPGTTGSINITVQPCATSICLPVPGLPAPPAGGSPLVAQNFNNSDGGCTVASVNNPSGPWTYSAANGNWFANGEANRGSPTDSKLTCPPVTVTMDGKVSLRFSHRYSFEYDGTRWDGGQVRISVNGGAFTAVPASGYSQPIQGNNILNGQRAYNGDSPGYANGTLVQDSADLGCFRAGDVITVQFVAAWDEFSVGSLPNWVIDSLNIDQAVAGVGTTANFVVGATATPAGAPMFIQWEVSKGGGPYIAVGGANSASYSFDPTLADDGNCYRAVITIPGAMAISQVACLNVTQPNTPPRFVGGPDQVVMEDAGPVCVPGWATEIFNHSIPRNRAINFNSQPPNSTLYHGLDTGPTPDPDTSRGYIAGGVMHLTDPVNSSYGDLALNLPGTQTFPTFDIRWRSLIGGGGGGGADGYSLNIGTDLPNPPSYGNPGEEGAGSGLRVAVDTFDNADIEVPDVGIEIVWQGARVVAATIPKDNPGNGVYLRKNTFVDASLTVDATGLATFTYDGTTISANLPGFTGLTANQLMFGARTGGANDNQWIDDITSSQGWVDTFLPADQSNAEANQTVKFIVANDHPEKFSVQPNVSANGTLCYTPAPNACGTVTVTVTAMDNGGTDAQCGGRDMSAPTNFVIRIDCKPDCPVIDESRLKLRVMQDSSLNFQLPVSDPDGDPITVNVTSPPAHGVVVLNASTGAGAYTPNAGYCGPDSFGIIVRDGTCSNTALVPINVICSNTCPTAVAKASPNAELSPNQTSTIIISVNNSNACVTLDGTMSTDPDGDTLTYVWLADLDGNGTKEPFASGAVVTNCFDLGEHEIMLVVDDGRCARSVSLTVEVLSACEAVELVIDKVDNADLGRRNKRPLIATLKAACASFDRGNCVSAVNQLEAFQNKVRAQIGHTNSALADEIIALTQEILDAIDCEKGNNGSGNGEDPPPPGNPPPND